MVAKTLVLSSDLVQAIQYDGKNKDEVIKFLGDLPYVQHSDDSLCVVDLSIYQSQTIVCVGDYIIRDSNGNYDCISKEQIEYDYVVVSTDKV